MSTRPVGDGSQAAGRDADWSPHRRRLDLDPGANDNWCFSWRLRRAGLIYVAVTLPLVALVGSLVQTRDQYIVAFVLLASAIYIKPALVVTWIAAQRTPAVDHLCWVLWFAGLGVMHLLGTGMLVGAATGIEGQAWSGSFMVLVVAVLFTWSVVKLVRSRSGRRALSVDIIEALMSVVVIVAPAALLWGERVVTAEATWYTVPATLATVAMVSGLYWAVVLVMRLGRGRRLMDATGVALCTFGVVSGVAQVAQGSSGFSLPSGPLLAAHGASMSLVLLVPLFLTTKAGSGLSRLPLHAQVRGGGLAPILTLVGVPVLVLMAVLLADRDSWVVPFALAVVALLVVLSALRQLVAVRETRRLYDMVGRTSEERHELLARVVQLADDDRHRVAIQLYEQAMAAYATFVSVQATSRSWLGDGGGGAIADASARARDDLARQADSLRSLMLAVRPLGADLPRADGLTAAVQAYVDSLYGDRARPSLDVTVDPELRFDWITETILFRILHEAIRNVWRHSDAARVGVSVSRDDDRIELRVEDDGAGFDPATARVGTGIVTMRSAAAFSDGSLIVESTPGEGTRVIARLGETPSAVPGPPDPPDPPPVIHLRLIQGEGEGEREGTSPAPAPDE